MEPWYKLVTPRKEVREGRSFNPDEFAIALEQVVAGIRPGRLQEARAVFLADLLHAGAAGQLGPRAASPRRQDREHRSGADARHADGRRQDAHADHALAPGQHGRGRIGVSRRGATS